MTPIRVLLVDDHAVVRMGYRTLLEGYAEIAVTGEAGSGEAALSLYQELKPDVVIMDLALPGIGGLEAIRRILQRDPQARVLVFSMYEDPGFVEQALRAGAGGYIPKSSTPEVLLMALKQVAAGEIYLDPHLAQIVAVQKSLGVDSPFAPLSPREFEVFGMLAKGHSVAEIAEKLSLSAKTVANYGTQIKAKLKASTSADLARLAIRHGVISA
jgi:DNA-binding NarL/FixJ family response regulator